MAETNRVSAYQSRASQAADAASGMATQTYRQASSMVRQNPGSSALLTFGVGFGLGLAITALMSESHPRRRTWRDTAGNWRDTAAKMPESWMHQISDAVARVLPDSVTSRM